jgi:hypothetical protein
MVLAILLLGVGCSRGPQIVPVAGQVLIDGKPLPHGFVQVAPEGFRAASGPVDYDGRFRLTTLKPNDGCVLGSHRVTVVGVQSIDGTSQRWHAPKKYADITSSDLTITIEGETDSLTINLTWAGGKPFVEKFSKER